MANPQLIIEVAGDSRKLDRTLKQTETKTKRWARQMEGISAASGLGGGLFGLGKGGALVAGAGGGLLALKSLLSAAAESQQVLGQTKVALEDTGLSWAKYGDQIEIAVAKQSKLGFDDEALLRTFSTFERRTGDVTRSLKLNALAADVARARYIDLESAAAIVLKASLGQAGALRRIGIEAKTGSTGIELITLLTQKYGGAATKAGDDQLTANARVATSFGNLKEQLGKGLLPAATKFADNLSAAADSATVIVQELQKIPAPGGGKKSFFGKLFEADSLRQLTAFATLIKQGNLVKFGELPTTTLRHLRQAKTDAEAAAAAFRSMVESSKQLTTLPAPKALATPPAFGEPGFKVGKAPPVPLGAPVELRNQWFDSDITRRLDKVQDIATIKGQIGALTEIAGLIKQRIKVTNDITRQLSLEDQLRTVQRQQRGLGEQLLADAAEAKRAAAEAKRAAKARLEAAAAIRLAQRTARQFRMLGLGPGGEAITPGEENLRKRVESLTARITGTTLDTPKLRAQLARFRKLLAESIAPTKEVRAKMDEMLRDIAASLNQGTGPLTATTQLSSERILAGLGLGRDTERILQARLSHFNSAGKALVGVGAGAATIVVKPPDVYLDGNKISRNTSKHQKRARNVNTSQRNGPNAGLVIT